MPELTNPSTPTAHTELVLKLGTTMQGAGAPTHRVELALEAVARRLGFDSPQLYATPNTLFFDDGDTTHLRRARAEILDIGLLAELDELVEAVIEAPPAPPAQAAADLRAGLRALEARSHGCPRWLAIAMAACVPPPFVLLLGGGWLEALIAAGVGLVTGELALMMQRTRSAPATELVAASLAAALAGLAASMADGLSGFRIVLAGLITLLPGFTLTLGMTELTSRHLVSGSARLTGAFSVLFQLVFGVALGASIVGADILSVPGAPPPTPPPLLIESTLLATLGVALAVMFGARVREIGWIVLTAGAAWAGARLGAVYLAPGLAGFTGALAMGVVANLVSAWRRGATVVLLVPGMMVLVPGSMGFRSFAALLGNDVASGIQGAFAMGLAAAGIAAGIFVASALIDPRRQLRRAAAPDGRRSSRRGAVPWLRA